MPEEEKRRLARLAAYVYIPIALLFAAIFLIVEFYLARLEHDRASMLVPSLATTTKISQ
jgi:hypothetical protein